MYVSEPVLQLTNQINKIIIKSIKKKTLLALEEIQGKGKMRKTKANLLNHLPQDRNNINLAKILFAKIPKIISEKADQGHLKVIL